MMRHTVARYAVVLATVAICVLLLALPAGAGPAASSGAVGLVSASETGVTWEVSVPWQELRLERSGDYVRVSLPGWSTTSQPGAPQLPLLAQALGAPLGAQVSVRVKAGRAHTVVLEAPASPVATQKVDLGLPEGSGSAPARPKPVVVVEEDPAIYGAQAPYPADLAEVTGDGMLRQQRVVGVAAYPVQYQPQTRELTVYESLRVEVSFQGSPTALEQGAGSEESAPYESVLRKELLNYEAARAWRRTIPARKQGAGPVSAPASQSAGASVQAVPWAPPVPGWRVKVREEGVYKLTYTQLLDAGVPVNTALAADTFQLYNLGREVAIQVLDADNDGVFESADAVVFYGQPVSSKYTRDNVYWLTYGHGPGLRMSSRVVAPGTASTSPYYVVTRRLEQNRYYVQGTPGNDELDRWMWNYVYPPSKPSWTHTFTVTAPYTDTYTATLQVAMLGFLQNPSSPDHHAIVRLNGKQLADVRWDGIAWRIVEARIAQKGLLVAGQNTVTVEAPNDTGVGYDVIYVDWVQLKFANAFWAENGELACTYEGTGAPDLKLRGFTKNEPVDVYDVTDPALVVRLQGVTVSGQATPYQAEFQDTVGGPTRYWARARTAPYASAQGIERDVPSNWRSTANGADHIIITHKDFATQAAQLRAFRGSTMRAVLVDVEDVYDEFGYGIAGAAPIHDFLAYTYDQWAKPAPSFVVLMGDGHYDPKNYVYSRTSYIPPYLAAVDPWLIETAADNRYVTLVGNDTLPDMMLGRLAVNVTASGDNEATPFVNKIIRYEEYPTPGDWRHQVLAVADNEDSGGAYAQLSNELLDHFMPAAFTAEKVYLGTAPHTTADAARAATLAGINAGKFIVNYVGHAATDQWADEQLFRAADVPSLTNRGKLPIMLPMTCLDGFYHYPTLPEEGLDAVAEVVTRADDKGAVASWSPSGLGVSAGHHTLDKAFFWALADDDDGWITLGEITMGAKLALKASGANLDLLDTYLLFGDPATMLDIANPMNVQLLWFAARGEQESITLKWKTASESDILGFDLQRAESLDGPRSKINAAIIPGKVPPGSTLGATYDYEDKAVIKGVRYYYWLEVVTTSGQPDVYGPQAAQLVGDWSIHLPVLLRP